MKNLIKTQLIIVVLALATTIKAQIAFTSSNLSTDIAKGTEAIKLSFVVNTDSLILPNNLTYQDIAYFEIEKTNGDILKTINKTPKVTSFTFKDYQIDNNQNIQEYTLVAVTKNGNKTIITSNKAAIRSIAPHLNCVKINHLYRKASHNSYDPNHSSSLESVIDETRVIELDVHSHKTSSFFGGGDQAPIGVWYVRHSSAPFGSENNNNCGSSNKNFNICLEDIGNWHLSHLGHDPIIVFLDLKSRAWLSNGGPFWRGNHKPTDLNNVLEAFANDFLGGSNNLYKPDDLKGTFSTTREAAENENWPSLGNLNNKVIFVLTGRNSDLNEYVNDLKQINRQQMAFIAVSPDAFANNSNGYIPQGINFTAEQEVVFYNLDDNQLNIAQNFTSQNGFIARSYPGNVNSQEYGDNIFFKVNNIAIDNISNNGLNANMDFQLIGINNITIGGTPSIPQIINSQYDNILQHALIKVTAKDLIVNSGTHYNIRAGQQVELLPGTDIREGSNVTISVGNCADYTPYLRIGDTAAIDKGRELTNKEIEWMLTNRSANETQKTIKEEVLMVYPNPTNDIVNISYTNYLSYKILFTLHDMTGRVVKSIVYNPQTEGLQNFSINIQELTGGTYFYTVQAGNQNFNGKIVKIDN